MLALQYPINFDYTGDLAGKVAAGIGLVAEIIALPSLALVICFANQ